MVVKRETDQLYLHHQISYKMKNDSIRFRLPSNEKAIVLKLANEAGLSLSDFMRGIISQIQTSVENGQ